MGGVYPSGTAMEHKLIGDLVIGLIVPPFLTGLWLLFVRINNRMALRQIEPRPWWNLIHGYAIVLLLTALDVFFR